MPEDAVAVDTAKLIIPHQYAQMVYSPCTTPWPSRYEVGGYFAGQSAVTLLGTTACLKSAVALKKKGMDSRRC